MASTDPETSAPKSAEPVEAAAPPLPNEPAPEPAAEAEPQEDEGKSKEDGEEEEEGEGDDDETAAGKEDVAEESNAEEGEGEGEDEAAPKVHKGANDWQAIWSAEANAYYFWNSRTQETTWTNPLETPSASTSSSANANPADPRSQVDYGGIDPDLAYLDPSLSRASAGGNSTFQARFNARTGRFQADQSMNPDRISEFNRGKRQQEAFYNVQGWEESLGGKGLKRAGEEDDGTKKKRVTAKDVERFKERKLDKKKKKLTAWLKD